MTPGVRAVAGLRVIVAGLAGAIAWIHIDLWSSHGYRNIPTIGALFILNGVAGTLLALASLAVPRKVLPLAWIGAASFAAATLAALLVSINASLFGFTETAGAPLVSASIGVEAAAVAVGVGAALLLSGSHRRGDP